MSLTKKMVIMLTSIVLFVCTVYFSYYLWPRELKIFDEFCVLESKKEISMEWMIIVSKEARETLMKKYKIYMPEVEFNKYNLVLAFNKRIKKLRYNFTAVQNKIELG
jgi:hypothetical protein